MSIEDDPLLRAMKAADPAAGSEFDDWASSDAGREVFARIIARRDAPAPRPARRNRPLRLILVASTALVVVAAVVAGVTITLTGSPGEVAQSSTTTTAPADAVDEVQALSTVILLTAASRGYEFPGLDHVSVKDIAEVAQAFGIITATDAERLSPGSTVDRATLALWLWRGLGDRLTETNATPADTTGLPDEVRTAVTHVIAAGLLGLTSDGLFEPDRVVSKGELERAISQADKIAGFKPR